jgi:hypothetical protein
MVPQAALGSCRRCAGPFPWCSPLSPAACAQLGFPNSGRHLGDASRMWNVFFVGCATHEACEQSQEEMTYDEHADGVS